MASLQQRIPPPLLAGIVHCLLVCTTAALTVWRSPGRDPLRPAMSAAGEYLVSPLSIWDGAWYQRIAQDGYADQQSAAFWPAYPLLIRLVSWLTSLDPATAGVAISNLSFVFALVVLHRLVTQNYGEDVAARAIWLIALAPGSFFFSAVYSESLFLLASVTAIYLARRNRWAWAALALFVATLTRSAGALVAPPVLLAMMERYGWSLRYLWRPGALVGSALSGPILFAAHLERAWDDPLLMIRVQEKWNREGSWPWITLWDGLRRTELIYLNARQTCLEGLADLEWPACRDALQLSVDSLSDDLATFSAILAFVVLTASARRLIPADMIYASSLLVLPLLTNVHDNPLLSFPRYALVAYPLFVGAAILLERRWLYVTVLVLSSAGLCWLLSIFARAYFVA